VVTALAHLITVRARGVTGALTLSRRMYLLVAQTDMSGVRTLPRAERYAPYLAGMTLELMLLLGCILLRLAGVAEPIPAVLAYLIVIQLFFQFVVFLRTDLYYVLTNWLHAGNLAGDALQILRHWRRRIFGSGGNIDVSEIPVRERRMANWYLVLYVMGVAAAVVNLVAFVLPVLDVMCRRALQQLMRRDPDRFTSSYSPRVS
jgi:putative peptide zinc metalloprotease protein